MAVRHRFAPFLLLCFAINWVVVLPPLRTWLDVLPLDLQGYESLGILLGVAGAAFLVTALADGRDDMCDLVARSLRWRVGACWYLLALFAIPAAVLAAATAMFGWATAPALADRGLLLTNAPPLLVMLILFFNLPEEIGWTGFLQARLQDHHGPLKAGVLTASPFAFFHMPVNVVEEGWVFAWRSCHPDDAVHVRGGRSSSGSTTAPERAR